MHSMHTPLKSSTVNEKKFCLMSFAAIDHRILIMIDNHVSYNKWIFWNKFPNL